MSILKKTNAPYLVSGALAIGTLLASGVFAVAPYVGFLAPVAALSLGLPFVIGGAIFSAVVIALSAVVIQKNGAIRRQSTLLHEEGKEKAELILELEKKNAQLTKVQAQEQEIAKKNGEISSLKGQLAKKDEEAKFSEIREKIANGAKVVFSPELNEILSQKKLEMVKQSLQEQVNKEKKHEDLKISSPESQQAEDEDIFYDTESGKEKSTENPSPKSQPTKEENVQGWVACSLGKAKSVMTGVVAISADVTKPYFAKITEAIAPNLNM